MTAYTVINPATGERGKTYPAITDQELAGAIATAHATFRRGVFSTTPQQRAQLIRRVGELHVERREELARLLVREMGKPIEQGLGEVDFCASIYEYYADHGASALADEPIELADAAGSAVLRRSPLGVLLGVMPWNYPYYQICRFAAPNLIAGNTVLLKPAPQCPESAQAVQQIFIDAGFPVGAYISVLASNDQVATIIEDSRVRGVSVTGSERAGAAVAEIAGRNLKKVVLELGGSDPFILLSTNDLDATVDSAVAARTENAGQACNAAKRFVVVDELYEPFVQKLAVALAAVKTGDPELPDTAMGPLSSTAAADRLEGQLRRAVEQGATLVTGGQRDGTFFSSAVLTGVTPDNEVYREEFFGPVAVVHRVDDEAEAVALANDTQYGLGAYVFTTDAEQGQRVADQIDSGMVWINIVGGDAPELPFGGVKGSGFGRELGRLGIDEFVNKKMIRTVAAG